MDLSPVGEAVLIAREGRRLRAYRDGVGVLTVGIGHTSAAGPPTVTPGLTITAAECDVIFARDVAAYAAAAECDVIFARDVAAYAAAVRKGLTVPVGQHAFDALVSVCYNIGPAGFAGSTLLRRLNAGDIAGARAALLLWRKPAAILPRRLAEAEQLVTPYATALPRPTIIAAPIAPTGTMPGPATAAPVVAVARPSGLARVAAWIAARAA